MNAHEIDYQIFGEEMQYVEIELDPQEAVIAEAGSFMMMDTGIKMENHIWRWRQSGSECTGQDFFSRQAYPDRGKSFYDSLPQPGTRKKTDQFCLSLSRENCAD